MKTYLIAICLLIVSFSICIFPGITTQSGNSDVLDSILLMQRINSQRQARLIKLLYIINMTGKFDSRSISKDNYPEWQFECPLLLYSDSNSAGGKPCIIPAFETIKILPVSDPDKVYIYYPTKKWYGWINEKQIDKNSEDRLLLSILLTPSLTQQNSALIEILKQIISFITGILSAFFIWYITKSRPDFLAAKKLELDSLLKQIEDKKSNGNRGIAITYKFASYQGQKFLSKQKFWPEVVTYFGTTYNNIDPCREAAENVKTKINKLF